MERRVRGNSHARCGPGEKMEIISKSYLLVSHAACYALIAYQTAYLKCHYFSPYFAALLTSVLDNSGKVAVYTDECARRNVTVLSPHVNVSSAGFTIQDDKIGFGLMAVKNLGKGLIDRIVQQRRSGNFTSFYDFCRRLYGPELNRRALESIIRCGALDGLGANRHQMIAALDSTLSYIAAKRDSAIEGQLDLFGLSSRHAEDTAEPALPAVEEYPAAELLEMEKASTGLYFSGHPLSAYEEAIKAAKADRLSDILANENNRYPDGYRADIFAVVTSVKLKTTKNGQQMAFVTVEDRYADMEMIVFPNTLTRYGNLLNEGAVLRIGASVSTRDEEERKLIADTLQTAPQKPAPLPPPADTPKKSYKKGLYLRVPDDTCTEYLKARQITDIFDGRTPLYIYFTDSKKLWTTPPHMHVDPNSVMLDELRRRLGDGNVKLVT